MTMILFGPSFDQAGANFYVPRPGGRQFNIVAELITIIDGAHRNNNFWLGMNDKVNENQYVYLSLQKNR